MFGPIGKEVYERTYQRGNETWADTVTRVVDGNLALVDEKHIIPGERERLIELMTDMKIIPAGRHLWASGAETSLGLYNCHRAGWGPSLSSHFTFTFDQLMLGGGVGANYSTTYLQKLPRLTSEDIKLTIVCDPSHPDAEQVNGDLDAYPVPTYTVPDTREGWVEALRILIEAHTEPYIGHLVIDVSGVREKGQPIKGFGGTASGPAPLVTMLRNVNDVMNSYTGYLTPLAAMEIDHEIAACVIAGNVRRSARMSIVHWNDPSIFQFINCKNDPSRHWSTNISVEVDSKFWDAVDDGDYHAVRVLSRIVEGMVTNGEPGIYNSALASEGEVGDVRATNPCGEIALEEWEQCCLGHVNLAAFPRGGWVEMAEAFSLMTRYLYRATFANSSDPKQTMVKQANRRIGVGFFGYQEWLATENIKWSDSASSKYVRACLSAMRRIVQEEAHHYALMMGEAAPIKCTTIAPTGTIAKLPGVTEGIHPIYAKYFKRRVRYADNDPALRSLADLGYEIEDCVYSANTKVVSYYLRDTLLDKAPADLVEEVTDLTPGQMFAVQAMIQEVYADNAVSFTANVSPNISPDALFATLRRYGRALKGTTVFPDLSRPQSPLERLTEDQYHTHHSDGASQSFDDCVNGACPVR